MKYFIYFLLILSNICLLSSCNDENFSTNPNDKLSFSVDTLSFDTTFSGIGSSTKRIMVYNKNKKTLRIDKIELLSGSNSVFKINVDGVNKDNHTFRDIEIGGRDSIYIFASVKVNELNSNAPLLIEDVLSFETNGNHQNVVLEAYGQDVEIFRGKTIYNDTILTADKPYVIYDSLIIAPQKTIRLAPGCRLYFHNNAYMLVLGNLLAEGESDNPVIIRGDRFDKINFVSPVPYNDIAGQWNGIYIYSPSGKNVLKHVNMNSGYAGIYIQNTNPNAIFEGENLPSLEVINSRIHNFILYGLYINNADLTVVNSEISNTASYSVYLEGGKHTFVHTTIANYFNSGKAGQATSRPSGDNAEPSVMIMNLNKIAPMKTVFLNSVIMGSMENELSLATRFPEYNGKFSHSYIRKPSPLTTSEIENVRWFEKEDKVFKNTYLDYDAKGEKYYNFSPDSISPVREFGDLNVLTAPEFSMYDLSKDLRGNERPVGIAPDAGAYQYIENSNEELP